MGDEVLREFAVRLASNVRAIDLPVRFGGEEFVVVMTETELADAHRIATRFCASATASANRCGGTRDGSAKQRSMTPRTRCSGGTRLRRFIARPLRPGTSSTASRGSPRTPGR